MVLLVADTNIFLSIFRLSLNIDALLAVSAPGCKIVVPERVLAEIRGLMNGLPEARGALELAERYEVVECPEQGEHLKPEDVGGRKRGATGIWDRNGLSEADLCVLYVAEKNGGVVFSNDRKLLAAAKERGIPRAYIRGKNRVVLVGVV